MTDIAQLGYSIDTSSVDAATAALDKHAAAAAKVAGAAKQVGIASSQTAQATNAAKASNDNLNRSLGETQVRFKCAHAEAHHLVLELLNIGRAGGNATQALGLVG